MNEENIMETAKPSQQPPTLDELKQLRASSKGSITRIKNVVDSNLSHTELGCRLGIAESYYKQALYYQTQIEKQKPSDEGRCDIDELFIATKTKILLLMGDRRPSLHDESIVVSHVPQSRLPNLKLPKFDGKYLEFKNFMNSFKNLVNSDRHIPSIEKFNHLLACLSGEALQTVQAFQVTEENYDKALCRLKERYDNDTLIFLENINALFEIPKAQKPIPKQIRHIVDTTSALYGSLNSLGTARQICDAIIIHMVMSKVDIDTKLKWDESIDFSILPSWPSCCAMLDKRCQQLDAQCRYSTRPQQSSYQHNSNNNQNKHSFLINQNKIVCTYCLKTGHYISKCQQFIVLPVAARSEHIKKLKICFNCFSKEHDVKNCSSRYSCRFCKQRHHSLLHVHISDDQLIDQRQEMNLEKPSTSTSSHIAAYQKALKHQQQLSASSLTSMEVNTTTNIILATAVVSVRDKYGKFISGRALLDSGSQVNFMTESFCASLCLKKFKNHTKVLGIGSNVLKTNFKAQTTIKSRINNYEMPLEFLISKGFSGYHPDENIGELKLPQNIILADPQFNKRRDIDMLVGAEVFFALLSVGQIRLGDNLPILQKTQLGWIVSGKCQSTYKSPSNVLCSFNDHQENINENIEMFWKLEAVVGVRKSISEDQKLCLEHFKTNTLVYEDGRIVVKLPLKKSSNTLGNSSNTAMNRFLSMEKRLSHNQALYTDYKKFMEEYEMLGHMSKLEDSMVPKSNFYIPHHCVLKPSSETTKLRVVFDGSCKSSSQVSLNDIMFVGPTIQNDLLITLLRFRCHRYGLTADAVKMYRQVMVHPDDRHLQLIFWRDDKSKPVCTYTLNTVTYGTAAAPYLAIQSLQYAAERYPVNLQIGKAVILNDFYVDDMLSGADDLQTLQLIKQEVTDILSYSKFTLSKWHSNQPDLTETTIAAK